MKNLKFNNLLLRKCKSLSKVQLGRSSSYSSLRSNSTRDRSSYMQERKYEDEQHGETIYVGSSRRRYVINPRYLSHPVLNALIEKSAARSPRSQGIHIKCEVVLFEHLLWMLDNADPNITASDFSLEELAGPYVF